MTKHTLLIALRLFFGLLTLVAIAIQLAIHLTLGFNPVNFFSYFTNLSNIFAAVVLLFGAFQLVTHREPSALSDLMRGVAVVNMVVVGIVFSILLRNVDLGALLPWINTLLHYIMPVVMVVEWFIQPPRTRLGAKQIVLCQLFPLLYLAYTLLRGAIIDWYPYPFLNPTTAGGYAGVAAYSLGIVVVFFFAGWLVLMLGNRLHNTVAPAPA